MEGPERNAWWERLPRGIREQIDGYVLQDSMMAAIRLVLEVGRVPDGIVVGTAQLIVGDRYEHHGDRIARAPLSPLDVESLARRARGVPGRVLAIEAAWDGDTVHDWFVRLLAVTAVPGRSAGPAEPAEEPVLATIHQGTAERYLGADRPAGGRDPVAVAAERAGGELAAHLGVPFHFASPDTPDPDAPRWRPTAPDSAADGPQARGPC